jgi:hypothetical protein
MFGANCRSATYFVGSLQDGQEDSCCAVSVCGVVKVMFCGDFSGEANADIQLL